MVWSVDSIQLVFGREEREVGGTAQQSGGNDWTGWDGYMGRPTWETLGRGGRLGSPRWARLVVRPLGLDRGLEWHSIAHTSG